MSGGTQNFRDTKGTKKHEGHNGGIKIVDRTRMTRPSGTGCFDLFFPSILNYVGIADLAFSYAAGVCFVAVVQTLCASCPKFSGHKVHDENTKDTTGGRPFYLCSIYSLTSSTGVTAFQPNHHRSDMPKLHLMKSESLS